MGFAEAAGLATDDDAAVELAPVSAPTKLFSIPPAELVCWLEVTELVCPVDPLTVCPVAGAIRLPCASYP